MKASSCCWHGIGTGVPARPGQIFGMCSISPSDFFHHTGGRLCKGGHSRKDARLTCGGVQGSCQQAEAKEDAEPIHDARTGRGGWKRDGCTVSRAAGTPNVSTASNNGVGTAAEECWSISEGCQRRTVESSSVRSCKRAACYGSCTGKI